MLQAPLACSSIRNSTTIIWYVRGNNIRAKSDVLRYRIGLSPVKVAKKLSTGEGLLAMLVSIVTPRDQATVIYGAWHHERWTWSGQRNATVSHFRPCVEVHIFKKPLYMTFKFKKKKLQMNFFCSRYLYILWLRLPYTNKFVRAQRPKYKRVARNNLWNMSRVQRVWIGPKALICRCHVSLDLMLRHQINYGVTVREGTGARRGQFGIFRGTARWPNLQYSKYRNTQVSCPTPSLSSLQHRLLGQRAPLSRQSIPKQKTTVNTWNTVLRDFKIRRVNPAGGRKCVHVGVGGIRGWSIVLHWWRCTSSLISTTETISLSPKHRLQKIPHR